MNYIEDVSIPYGRKHDSGELSIEEALTEHRNG